MSFTILIWVTAKSITLNHRPHPHEEWNAWVWMILLVYNCMCSIMQPTIISIVIHHTSRHIMTKLSWIRTRGICYKCIMEMDIMYNSRNYYQGSLYGRTANCVFTSFWGLTHTHFERIYLDYFHIARPLTKYETNLCVYFIQIEFPVHMM